jgi:hypothetical protein
MCSFSPASWKNKKLRKGIFRCISKRNKLTGEREGSRNLIFPFLSSVGKDEQSHPIIIIIRRSLSRLSISLSPSAAVSFVSHFWDSRADVIICSYDSVVSNEMMGV